MSENQLTRKQMESLLDQAKTGSLSTLSPSGYPYTLPVHFVRQGDKIYLHGRIAGEKLDNIQANPKVGFLVYQMGGLKYDPEQEAACEVYTEYESVVIRGDARLIEDLEEKKKILWAIVAKYMPDMTEKSMPDGEIRSTAVIEITPAECSGKFYK